MTETCAKCPSPTAVSTLPSPTSPSTTFPGREGRREAIREIVRTLKQGGQVAISDVFSLDLYADELRKSHMIEVEISGSQFLDVSSRPHRDRKEAFATRLRRFRGGYTQEKEHGSSQHA